MTSVSKFALRTLVVVGLSLAFVSAWAGKGGADSSGGGGGVQIGEKVYLYDLYEAGLEESPYIAHKANDLELEVEFQKARLPHDAPIELLTRKIQDIEGIDPYLAAALVEGAKVLSWRVVDQKLERSPDFGDIKELDVLQVANRRGGVVQIQRVLWNQMDSNNRVALILHEVLAALQPAKAQGNQGPLRRLVAYLFDQKYYEGSLENGQIALEGFPSYFEAVKRLSREKPELPIAYRHFTRYVPTTLQNGKTSIKPTGTYLLSPFIDLIWSAPSDQESQRSYVIPHYFELPFKQYCSLPRKGPQLLEMQINYFRMKVSLSSFQPDGSTLPMLNWVVDTKYLTTLVFDPKPSKTKANCTPEMKSVWETMKYWNQSLAGEAPSLSDL